VEADLAFGIGRSYGIELLLKKANLEDLQDGLDILYQKTETQNLMKINSGKLVFSASGQDQ